MTDEIVVKVTKKGLNSRSFNIEIDGSLFDIVLDERQYVHVQGKKIGPVYTMIKIPLGSKSGEIEAHFYHFGGLKIINLRVEDQIVYSEKLLNPQASKIDAVVNKIVEIFLCLFFASWPIGVITYGIANAIGLLLVTWLKLGQTAKELVEPISAIISVISAITILLQFLMHKVDKNLLVKKQTIAEIESEHLYHGVPFGYGNHNWEEFKSHYKEGDEIWQWSTSPMTWKMLVGRDGYVIVREGKTTRDSIVTGMN